MELIERTLILLTPSFGVLGFRVWSLGLRAWRWALASSVRSLLRCYCAGAAQMSASAFKFGAAAVEALTPRPLTLNPNYS